VQPGPFVIYVNGFCALLGSQMIPLSFHSLFAMFTSATVMKMSTAPSPGAHKPAYNLTTTAHPYLLHMSLKLGGGFPASLHVEGTQPLRVDGLHFVIYRVVYLGACRPHTPGHKKNRESKNATSSLE